MEEYGIPEEDAIGNDHDLVGLVCPYAGSPTYTPLKDANFFKSWHLSANFNPSQKYQKRYADVMNIHC